MVNTENNTTEFLSGENNTRSSAFKANVRKVMFVSKLRSAQSSPFIRERDENEKKRIKRVTYNSDSHLSVIFQTHGSVWWSVLPFCLVNVLITYLILLARRHGLDLTFPPDGHSFMAILVSFLVVTRTQIIYNQFMDSRYQLSELFRSLRELIHHVCVLTMLDSSRGAKEWRQDVAFRMILLLRVSIAAIEFRSSKINTWEVIPEEERNELNLYTDSNPSGIGVNTRANEGAHDVRKLREENFRAPIIMAYNLRADIMKQRNRKYLQKDMHPNEETKMLGFVSDYVTAFHGLKKTITTPFPFPLVQMARTFLFFWVFTLPFALIRTMTEPVQVMLVVFFTTFGFIGLEYVSMEMDDPFGDDPNDFDDLAMAQMVFEDIYITIFKLDGPEAAEALRSRISDRVQKGSALQNYHQEMSKSMGGLI